MFYLFRIDNDPPFFEEVDQIVKVAEFVAANLTYDEEYAAVFSGNSASSVWG